MLTESRAIQRVQAELREFLQNSSQVEEVSQERPIKIQLIHDNWSLLRGTIAGPPETAYAGGSFELDIMIPNIYPIAPPLVRFITKVWHPNVSHETGEICIDILKNEWKPSMTIRSVLSTLQQFLATPNIEDPLDMKPARQMRKHDEIYKRTAQHWTAVYAGGPNSIADYEERINVLVGLGVDKDYAIKKLSASDWNLGKVITRLSRVYY